MSTAYVLLVVVTSAICAVITYPISIHFVGNICCTKSKQDAKEKSNKKINITSICVYTCYCIVIHCYVIQGILELSNNGDHVKTTVRIAELFYFFGQLFILFVFALRIQYTFIGSLSIFAYSSNTIKFIYCLIILVFVLIVIAVPLEQFFAISGIILMIFILMLYILIYLFLSILFIKQVIVMIQYKIDRQNNNDTVTENNNNADNADNADVINVTSIDLLIRYSLLVMIGFISTVIGYIMMITFELKNTDTNTKFFSLAMIVVIDSFINAFCVYLLFGFAKNIYYKLCKFPDIALKSICIHKMRQKQINNKNLQTKQQFEQLLFS